MPHFFKKANIFFKFLFWIIWGFGSKSGILGPEI